MSSLPTVSVVVCAYNYERYVAEAIDSALAQDHPHVEIVVVDDGSTDRTPEILAGYGERIRVVRQANAGLNAATQRGIEEARGEIVALLDADDRWAPDKLSRQVALLQARPEVGLVFSDMALIDADGAPLAPSYFAKHGMRPPRGRILGALLAENLVPAPTIAFRRALAAHVLPVAAEASFQDWWLALRVAEVAELDWIDAPLVSYRIHGSNMASGAGGEKWARNVRADNRFRRWMLSHLDVASVAARDLEGALARLERDAGIVASRMGTTPAAELEATAADRARWAAAVARAHAARRAGDVRAALEATIAAAAADPSDPAAREAVGELAARADEVGFVTTLALPGTPQERLDAAEAAFGEGAVEEAEALLLALAAEPLDAALRAQVHNDLAVLAVTAEDLDAARRHALTAVAADPRAAAPYESLGRVSEAEGDHGQAEHWFARAATLDPADPDYTAALFGARDVRTRPSVIAPRPVQAPADRGRVLVCVDFFHPSVGGSERLAEQVGLGLRELGWHVEVATRALPTRRSKVHLGMRVHEVRRDPAAELRRIVARGGYDAVLAFSDPRAWPVPAVCALDAGGPRRVVVPCINPEILDHIAESHERIAAYHGWLGRADAVAHSSLGGVDAKLNASLRVPSAYVPNAAARLAGTGSLRGEFGIDADEPLLLVVGNLWPEKNHTALLTELCAHPGGWHLVHVGGAAPGQDALAARVAALADADPRVHLAGPRSPEQVAGAMREADLLLLPSLAEATPLVLVEAMSQGLPWIATPACGAAHDHAGGLILPVHDMGAGVEFLLADPAARDALAEAGRAHWEAAYTWELVCGRYDALLRGASLGRDPLAPVAAVEATEAVRAAAYDALVAPAPVAQSPSAARR